MPDIAALSTFSHYHDHLWPIIEGLRSRGRDVLDLTTWRNSDFAGYSHPKDLRLVKPKLWLVAGATDADNVMPEPVVYVEHGAGQCLVPETKVLRADLRWVPVGHLVVGDEIIGFNEHAEGKGRPRQWERTTVTATRPLVMPCYRITMTDGTVITASENHLWLRRMNGHHEWMRTDALQDRARWPKRASKLLRLFDEWDEDRSWGGGYLAAAFDGEGSFTQTVRDEARQNRMMLAFTQKGNAMLALAKIELRARGFDYREDHHAASGVTHLAIRGGTREVMRFLGSIRPRRLLDNFVPLDRGKMLGEAVEVAEVVPVGDRVVIGLTTSSGTLIAEGFASHNTYEADLRGVEHVSYSTGSIPNAHLYLCPNLFVQARRARTGVLSVAVGSPRLDEFPIGWHDGVDERAVVFAFHWDLVPEGQIISGPRPTGGSVRHYDGEIIRLVTANHALAVSPDHPVLTRRGWVRAGEVEQGDYLVRRSPGERHVGLHAHDELVPSRVEDVAGALFEALRVVPGPVPPPAPHLDGDRLQEQVGVVRADGFLADGFTSASLHQRLGHRPFEGAVLSHVEFAGGGTVAQLIEGRGSGGTGDVVTLATERHPGLGEAAVDGGLADAEALGELLARDACGIEAHQVIGVERVAYVGHGYDFTTVPHWYEVNGFIVHNCELVPEAQSAWPWFQPEARRVAIALRRRGMLPVAHAHPRIAKMVRWHLERAGFEWWDYDDVLTKGACLVADNTSALYEFAHVDRPIVVLNAPWYRKHVHHGLRFWECIPGLEVDELDDLVPAIFDALGDDDPGQVQRQRCAEQVFPLQDGNCTARAVAMVDAAMQLVSVT